MNTLLSSYSTETRVRLSLLSFAFLVCLTSSRLGATETVWSYTDQSGPTLTTATGEVLDVATGAPIAGARVTLATTSSAHSTVTGSTGSFSFVDVPIGTHKLAVTADGYFPGEYGQVWPNGPGRSLELAAAKRGDVRVRLWKPGSVTGTVRTAEGEGIAHASVEMLPIDGPSLPDRSSLARILARTDRDGAFRFTSIAPGRYFVAAIQSYGSTCVPSSLPSGSPSCRAYPVGDSLGPRKLASGHVLIYPTTFFPATLDASAAEIIPVRAGVQVRGIDISLEPLSTVQVSGLVLASTDNVPFTHLSLTRLGNHDTSFADRLKHVVAATDAQGRFQMAGVPPGDYELRAIAYPRVGADKGPYEVTDAKGGKWIERQFAGIKAPTDSDPLFEARRLVTVGDSDVRDVAMPLQRASSLRGLADFGSGQSRPSADDLARVAVFLQPVNVAGASFAASARLDTGAAFEFPSLASGKYVMSVRGLIGWIPHSIELNGRVVEDDTLDVRCCGANQAILLLTNRPSALAGTTLRTAQGSDDEQFVFVFPADSRQWSGAGVASPLMFRSTRTSHGRFTMAALRAGDYFVAAVQEGSLDCDWREPESLKRLSEQSVPVTLRNGATTTVSPRPVRLR